MSGLKFDLFIHSNFKNKIPALVTKYSFKKNNPGLNIYIKNLEDCKLLKECHLKTFIRNGIECLLNIFSSQSFFFVRFICCELAKYIDAKKWILIIDPDIFCLKSLEDINDYIDKAEASNKSIICHNNTSSFMVINRDIIDWNEESIVNSIFHIKEDAENYMGLSKYKNNIYNIPQEYNSYDLLTDTTICLHTSLTHTQPWKTGISYFPSDLHNLVPQKGEKKDQVFQKHKSNDIISVIFDLFSEAFNEGYFTEEDLKDEIERENIRPDIFELIK